MLQHIARNEEQWDRFVSENGGGFLQSWEWARFQEALGRTVYRFRVDEQGEESSGEHADTIAQFLAVVHDLPLGVKYVDVPRGPVVRLAGGGGRKYFETCIGALRDAAADYGASFVRIGPPLPEEDGPVAAKDLLSWGFRRREGVQPADTMIVDLGPDADALLARMHHKTRYNIRLAERKGVTVRDAAHGNAHMFRKDIDLFWNMLSETAGRDRFRTHERKYYETMLDVLSMKKRGGMTVRLRFAEYGGDAVAAALLGRFGGRVTYLHGASASRSRNVMAPYLLHWSSMLQAKEEGAGEYDLWGVAPEGSGDHPWAGVTRFKEGFGGRREGYLGTWELPTRRFWYTVYRAVKKLKG